jgi:AraC family transcriptional regulator
MPGIAKSHVWSCGFRVDSHHFLGKGVVHPENGKCAHPMNGNAAEARVKLMRCSFSVMNSHVPEPRVDPVATGRLVLSKLSQGASPIAATAASLKLCLEGEESYEIDGRMVHLSAGRYLYLAPGADCTAIIRSHSVGLCIHLPIRPSTLQERAVSEEPLELAGGRALVLSTETSFLGRQLKRQGRYIAANPGEGDVIAPAIVAQAAEHLADPIGESRDAMARLAVAKAGTRRDLFQRLELARGYLHAHPHRSISLGDLAAEVGLSEFHMARYFKMAFGQSPIRYHRTIRLERAARLIERDYCLADAAELTGYSDAASLSHAFRRNYGHSPRTTA